MKKLFLSLGLLALCAPLASASTVDDIVGTYYAVTPTQYGSYEIGMDYYLYGGKERATSIEIIEGNTVLLHDFINGYGDDWTGVYDPETNTITFEPQALPTPYTDYITATDFNPEGAQCIEVLEEDMKPIVATIAADKTITIPPFGEAICYSGTSPLMLGNVFPEGTTLTYVEHPLTLEEIVGEYTASTDRFYTSTDAGAPWELTAAPIVRQTKIEALDNGSITIKDIYQGTENVWVGNIDAAARTIKFNAQRIQNEPQMFLFGVKATLGPDGDPSYYTDDPYWMPSIVAKVSNDGVITIDDWAVAERNEDGKYLVGMCKTHSTLEKIAPKYTIYPDNENALDKITEILLTWSNIETLEVNADDVATLALPDGNVVELTCEVLDYPVNTVSLYYLVDGNIYAFNQSGEYTLTIPAGYFIFGEDSSKEITYTYEIKSTAVNSLDVDTAAPIYYNLQGARVLNPEKGLYIRLTNGRPEKILLP